MAGHPPIMVRPVTGDDLPDLLLLAQDVGLGFTNLPADRSALAERIVRSTALLTDLTLGGAIILGLEIEGRIRGCGMVFPRIGVDWPFYSYRISHTTQRSSIDGSMVRFPVLTLTNDLEDCAEVGGLVIDPELRASGLGRVIARSRYMFIAQHRARFGNRVIADLRGWLSDGRSPFWDAVGGRFYVMDFAEADRINGITGNQFIADLGPRAPIYVNMLSDAAQAAIGQVHEDGRGARALLLDEGFCDEGYVDIFDAGPTMVARIDALKAVRTFRRTDVSAADSRAPAAQLISTGEGAAFRCTAAAVEVHNGRTIIDPTSAAMLGLSIGDRVGYFDL